MFTRSFRRPAAIFGGRALLAVAWLALAPSACSREGGTKIAAPSSAGQSAAFPLEPSRPEEQFELSTRYDFGDGVQGDDAWAEYWAWRAARQGHEPAREWLRKRANAEPLDEPAVFVFRARYRAKRSYPASQLWLALTALDSKATPEVQREAGALIEQGLPVVREKAVRGDAWAKYLVGIVQDVAFGDPVEALRWYTEAAEQGHVLAQDSVGHMYEAGRGTPADSAAAVRWFQAAAAQGHAPSESMLGWLYDRGRGVEENPSEALRWFAASAAQGHAPAEANLGTMYDRGRGTPENPGEAARWYLKAAQRGLPFAQNRLGSLYATGRGVARDEGEARRWFRAAAEGGDTEAVENLRLLEILTRSAGADVDVSPALLARAAVAGDAETQYRLATLYDRGQSLHENPTEAARWYKRAAEQNHVEAQVRLAIQYHEARGVARDDEAAASLFRKAAAKENHQAERYLGELYESGLGVPKDNAQAVEWYQRAARGGDAKAKGRMAHLECERSAATRALGVLLRCADRASLKSAARAAGLTVVREDAGGALDVYEGTELLGVPHTVKIAYSSEGKFTSLVHELPPTFDAKALKRITAELASTYGGTSAPATASPEAKQSFALRDGLELEISRGKNGAEGRVVLRLPSP